MRADFIALLAAVVVMLVTASVVAELVGTRMRPGLEALHGATSQIP